MTTPHDSRKYTATLTNSGRAGWSVIFRHPVIVDPGTGQPPLRIKRGLGTQDELNSLLADPAFWNLGARSVAAPRFESRVIDIFFSPMVPEELNHALHREKYIHIPATGEDGYRSLLLMGTTGAGKTTLVRQLLGTDPRKERFPSVSTSRCTVADTELVLTDGPFEAVATFASQAEVREAVDECLAAAVLAAHRKLSDGEIVRRMLNHVDQRFRFSYVLGSGKVEESDESEADDPSLPDPDDGVPELTRQADLAATNKIIADLLNQIKEIAERHGAVLRRDLVKSENDQRVADELFEEELDKLLTEDEEFQAAGDQMMGEIRRRFDLLDPSCVEVNRQDWPVLWHWQSEDRQSFLREVTRFSSNYAPLFGQLLTPLVNGMRVCGPFVPEWRMDAPKLVLIDVEGLGHSAESSSTIPSSLVERFDQVDAIVLVDNGTQPMQAASMAALRAIISSGSVDKLLFAFTHFDQVQAPNLASVRDRESHILGAAENMIRHIGEQLGPQAMRDLRRRLEHNRFFLGGINQRLDLTTRSGKRTAQSLNRLVDDTMAMGKQFEPVAVTPVYDRFNLVLAIRNAAITFHEDWRGILGLAVTPRTNKAHWARVKALNRRLAEGWAEEYISLAPIADLWTDLREQIYRVIQNPVEWQGRPVLELEDEARRIIDLFANQISSRLGTLVRRRIRTDRIQKWQSAYGLSGRGSTFTRARVISSDIYETAAPIPDAIPSPDGNIFFREVIQAVDEAATECNVTMR